MPPAAAAAGLFADTKAHALAGVREAAEGEESHSIQDQLWKHFHSCTNSRPEHGKDRGQTNGAHVGELEAAAVTELRGSLRAALGSERQMAEGATPVANLRLPEAPSLDGAVGFEHIVVADERTEGIGVGSCPGDMFGQNSLEEEQLAEETMGWDDGCHKMSKVVDMKLEKQVVEVVQRL